MFFVFVVFFTVFYSFSVPGPSDTRLGHSSVAQLAKFGTAMGDTNAQDLTLSRK